MQHRNIPRSAGLAFFVGFMMLLAAARPAEGQPANYAWIASFDGNFTNSRTFTDGATGAAIRRLTIQATEASRDYVIEWDSFSNKWQNTSTPLNQEFTLFHGGSASPNGQLTADAVIDDYYTFQIDGLAYNDRAAVVMQTSAPPVNFADADPVSFDSSVRPGEAVDISITLAGNKSPEERAFVRYSTDNFASSDVAEVTFASPTESSGTATIPAAVNQDGRAVSFYVYTTTVAANSSSNHDLISLAIANNGGSNYSYTPVFPTPEAIPLSSPADAATNVAPQTSFVWEAGENIDEYVLQLAVDSSFGESDIVTEEVTADTSVVISLRMNETYYWRVRGRNSGGEGPFSPASSFTTLAPEVTLSGNGNTGFGGVIGNSVLEIGDDGSQLYFNFVRNGGNTANFADELVLYFSTGASGRGVMDAEVNDQNSTARRAVSSAGTNASVLRFLEGFEATHAAVLSPDGSALFEIPASESIGNGGLSERTGLPDAPDSGNFEFSFSYSDLGLNDGDAFDIVGIYLNGENGFTSNEGYGLGFPDGNIGGEDFDFGSFINYPTGTERTAYISVADGSWSSPASWNQGEVPPAGSAVVIASAVTLDVDAEPARLEIQEGASLSFDADPARKLTFNPGGRFINNGTFDAGANGQLVFAGDGSSRVAGSSETAFPRLLVPPNTGTQTLRFETSVNVASADFSGETVLEMDESVSLSFETITLRNALSLPAGVTVSDTLTVAANGFMSGRGIRYEEGALLRFDTGGAYTINDENAVWSSGSWPEAGVPYHVEVAGSSPLNLFAARSTGGDFRLAAGQQLIQGNNAFSVGGGAEINGTFSFVNDGARAFSVGGALSVNAGGSLSLSQTVGGDIELGGDLSIAAGGSFESNGRALLFNGAGAQSLSHGQSAALGLELIILEKSGGQLTLQDDVAVSERITLNAGALAFAGGAGLSGRPRLELGGGALRAAQGLSFSTLRLTEADAASEITLDETGSFDLQFASSRAENWADGARLDISGWQGTPGQAGTGGRLLFAAPESQRLNRGGRPEAELLSLSQALTPQQRGQIRFDDGGSGLDAVLLEDGGTQELVPVSTPPPGAQATNFTAGADGRFRLDLSWENGGGTGRIILLREGAAVSFLPADGQAYDVAPELSEAHQLDDDGHFVVYTEAIEDSGAAGSATVSGLSSNTVYHLAIYEFSGDGSERNYLTDGSLARVSAQTGNLAITQADGKWSEPATWVDGLPEDRNRIQIADSVNFNIASALTRNIEITTGGRLVFDAADELESGPVLRILNDSGIVNNNESDTDAGAGLDARNGRIIFSGAAALSGAGRFLLGEVDMEGGGASTAGVDFGSNSFLSGTLRLLPASFISANPPVYLEGSTLRYATGGNFGAGQEWPEGRANAPAGIIIENTSLALANVSGARYVKGPLSILENGSLSMDAGQAGAELVLEGDLSVAGSFTPNGRALRFEGSDPQQLSVMGENPLPLFSLVLNKSDAALSLSGALDISERLVLGEGRLRFNNGTSLTGTPVLRMEGGRLETGNQNLSFSTLELAANGEQNPVIQLNDGTGATAHQLQFANSRDAAWSGEGLLTVEAWSGAAGQSGSGGQMLFTPPGLQSVSQPLTPAQRARVEFDGFSANGFISAGGGQAELVPFEGSAPTEHARDLRLSTPGPTGTFQLDLSWEPGNGQGRIIVAAEDAAVSALPADGQIYGRETSGSRALGFGEPEAEIGNSGEFVVFDSEFSTFSAEADTMQAVIGNLLGEADLHFAIFEFNESGGQRIYFTSGEPARGNFSTSGQYASQAAGDWSAPATWREGVIPPSGVDITISHAVRVDVPTAVARNLTIDENGALSFSDDGQGVLTLTGGSSFTNGGSFDGAHGKVVFQGGGSITESSAEINAVTFSEVEVSGGSMMFRDDTLINTRLSLLPGGRVSGGNAPLYAPDSELRFAQDETITLGSGTAWLPADTADANLAQRGIPFNVRIDGTTELSFDGPSPRIAKGQITIAGGARLQLSDEVGGDLRLFGDWENQGRFDANNRAVFFSGGGIQTIRAGQPSDFGFMILENDSEVVVASETAAAGQIELNSGILRLAGDDLISGEPRLLLKGGALQSDGFSASFGPLRLEQAAQIELGSGAHQLHFANSRDENWTNDSSRRLLITGWQGTPGASGTGGQITVARPAGFNSGLLSTTQGFTPEQRAQIRFENTAGNDFKTAFLDAETARLELIPISTDEENPPIAHAEGLGLDPDSPENVGTFYADLKWKNGGGSGRILVARAGAPVNALPADGKRYGRAAGGSRIFGFDVAESEIGNSGNFVVFDSAFSDFDDSVADSSKARIKRIAGDSNVHFAIFEYTGSGSERNYLTTDGFATFSQQTDASYATTGGGNWNDAGVWPNDIAPVSPVEITISHDVVVNVATATLSDIIIEENRTLSFAAGGALLVSAGSIQAAGNLDACSGNAPAGCTGKITFNNGVEITGSGSIHLHDVDVLGEQGGGGVRFGANTTVYGTFTLFENTFVDPASTPPAWAEGSTLAYDTGGSYNINREWPSVSSNPTAAEIAASPWNVRSKSTALRFPDGSSDARLVRNDLTIEAPESGPAAGFTFPDSPGGDLFVGGDVQIDGSLNANNRALFVIGGTRELAGGPQQLRNNTGAALALPFVFIQNPDGLSVTGDLVFEGFDAGGSFVPAVLDIAENAAFSTSGGLRFVNGAEIRLNRSESGEGLLSESITSLEIAAGQRFSVDVEAGRPLSVDTELRLREGATLAIDRGRLEVRRLVLDEGHLLDIENGTLDIGEISTALRLEGEAGWRMFGPPAADLSYQELLAGVFTQGIPGATTSEGAPNVFIWNPTAGQYEVPADLNTPATQAVLVFMFEESDLPADVRNGTGLPFSRVQGDGTEAGGTLLSGASQRFHLLHNPYGTPVTLDEAAAGVSRNNLYNTFYVWDAAFDPGDGQAKGGWRFGNALLANVQPIIDEFNIDENDQQRFPFESLDTSVIAPFQGFLVEVETEAGPGDFTLTEQARRNAAAFIGNPAAEESGARPAPLARGQMAPAGEAGPKQAAQAADFGQPGLLGMALEHTGNGAKTSALLAFSETGEHGFDGYDIRLRGSLNSSSIQLFTRSANAQRLRLNHLPQQPGEALELPLNYAAGSGFETGGTYRLSWPIMERIPQRWQLQLVDTYSGDTVNMRRAQEYLFTVETPEGGPPKRASTSEQLARLNAIMQEDPPDKQVADRFLIRILPPEPGDDPQRLSQELRGPNEGWRMLSAPAHGITYEELLSGLWTQGFPDAAAENGAPSVFIYDESIAGWQAPASLTNYFGTRSSDSEAAQNAGKAALVYIFEDDDYDGTPDGWPKRISATAIPLSGTYEQSFSFSPEAQEGDVEQAGWHLTGNPFHFSLDWRAVMEDRDNRESGISDAVYIWDANLGRGGYRVFNSLLSPADLFAQDALISSRSTAPVIEAFQGFWIKTGRDGALLRLRPEHDHAPDGKQHPPETSPGLLALQLSGEELHAGLGLSFTPYGKEARDTGDAPQLASLSASGLYFYSKSADGQALSINNLPELTDGQQRIIPLYVESSEGGLYELRLGRLSGLPDEAEAWLHDLETGRQWRLEEGFQQSVFIETAAAPLTGAAPAAGSMPVPLDQARNPAASPRFELHILPGVPSSGEPQPSIPDAITLAQNYPNPFNPVTRIEYGLPEAGPVRLEIFNMLGQRVAVLVNEEQPAGYHAKSFDASALSSGVYVYRLQTRTAARTARMTLLK